MANKKADSNKFPPMPEAKKQAPMEQAPMEQAEPESQTPLNKELTGEQEILILRDPGIANQQTLARLDKAIAEIQALNVTLNETKDVLLELGEALLKRLDALIQK